MRNYIIYILLITLCVVGCSKKRSLANIPSDVKWQRAENFFNRGKYAKAIPYYEQIVLERSSIYTADAQFRLGDCHFNRKNYLEAIFEYQELLRLFPDNRRAADAQFQIGLSYVRLSHRPHFTQEETDKAIDAFTLFTERYPRDSRVPEAIKHINDMQLKLIEKVYLNGYIYYKMKDYPASQLYLNEILALANRNDLEKMAIYYTALIHIDRREREQAEQMVERLATHFPNSKEHRSATKRLARIDSRLWRLIYMY